MNGILALHAIPKFINSRNPVVTLDYASAWTWWPGTVHIRDFRLRGHDRQHLEFSFRVDRVYAVISLLPLVKRTFRATHVEVEGVDARFRMLFDATERAQAVADLPLLPPIEGFEVVPMQQFGPEELPVDEAHDVYWTVDLEDVHLAHVTQFWVQDYRLQFDGTCVGRFGIHPTREFDLGPAQLDIAKGTLRIGDTVVATNLEGHVASTVRAIPLRDVHDNDFLHFIDGTLSLVGAVPSAAFLSHFLPDAEFSGGAGPLTLVAGLDRGVLTTDTRLKFESAALQASTDALQLAGPLSVDVAVVAGAEGRRAVGTLTMKPAALAHQKMQVESGEARLRAVSPDVDLAGKFDTAQLTFDAERLDLQISPWLALLPAVVHVESGRARGELHVEMAAPSLRGHGSMHLVTPLLTARLAQREVRGAGEVSVALDHFDLHADTLELRGSKASWISSGAPSGNAEAPGWWFRAELEQGELNLHGAPAFEAVAEAHARDGRPVLEQLSALGEIPHAVSSALTLNDLVIRARAHLAEGMLTLSPMRVSGGSSELLGTARVGESVDAVLLVRSGPLSTGVVITHSKLQVQMVGAEDRFKLALDANGPRAAVKPATKGRPAPHAAR